jgi:antitoxin component HigA of HigAB toxin-antitoxin module
MTYKEAIKEIENLLNVTPELNLQNYTHEEVADTVDLTNEIWAVLQNAND